MNITASRLDLSSEVDNILSVDHVAAGEAAKLRGKFQFALDARFCRCRLWDVVSTLKNVPNFP